MAFKAELATPTDDSAIRQLLVDNPVPGHISVSFEREPNYFLGCETMGRFNQVIVLKGDPPGSMSNSGKGLGKPVAGILSRSTRPLFLNGQEEEVGLLSQARVDKRVRRRWLVSQGLRFFRELHSDGRVPGYLATITEENVQAKGILVDRPRRPCFPSFREVCRLSTQAIILRKPKPIPTSSLEVCRGSVTDLPEIISLFRRHGPAKQFFPAYTEADFREGSLTLGFQVEDFILARRGGELVGAIGLWDQSEFKQTVLRSYSGWMGRLRPMCNLGLELAGACPLPPPGQKIRSAYASFTCVADNDPAIFDLLLRHIYNLATERGLAFLMVGLSERDPLLTVVRPYLSIPYRFRLYTVCWKEEEGWRERLDGRIPYVEIAAL